MEYLVGKIVEQIENSKNDWRDGAKGNRSLSNKKGELYSKEHIKSEVVEDAIKLEKTGLIEIEWLKGFRGNDIERLKYQLEKKELLYEYYRNHIDETFVKRQDMVRKYRTYLEEVLKGIRTPWIRCYYEDLLENTDIKNPAKQLAKQEKYAPCFQGLDQLKEPIFKRIFSKYYLGDSKKFENECQNHIVSVARKYFTEVIEPEMEDYEVLSQLLIEGYSQEMMVKGPLYVCVPFADGDRVICTKDWKYGVSFNSEMLKNVKILENQPQIKRVISIENKANFICADYEEDTIYVFSHGYFSPLERQFLCKLEKVLEKNIQNVEYHHSGDLDYGGVKIFQYIRNRIFPKLKPLWMDVETFQKYKEYGYEIEPSTMEKLEQLKETELQDLIDVMVETGIGIEQESFLV